MRNLTTLSRLLDVLPVFHRDHRIELYWTVDHGSRFADGLVAQLRDLGVKLLSWADAVDRSFELVLAAHVGDALNQLDGPLLVVQHGVGFNRRVPSRTGDPDAPVGISPKELLHNGKVVPDHIGVSDECLLTQLRQSCPEAHDRGFVMGDPTWDRITRNRDAWRDRLRAELGVRAGQRVVAVSTTWNTTSLWGQRDNLVERLLAQLPVDEYKVLLVVHPNVWVQHGLFELEYLLADARESGLVTVVPHSDWHVAAVVADLAVGDHGTVSVYFAALGIPFFLTGTGEDELAAGSTTRAFVDVARRLDSHGDLLAQLDEAAPPSAEIVAAAGRPLARHSGKGLILLQDKVYEILGRRAAGRPKPRPYEPRFILPRPCTAFHVVAEVHGRDDHGGALTLRRFPAALAEFRPPPACREHVLVAEETEADTVLLESAEVVVSSHIRRFGAALERADRLLAELFCSLAGSAVDDGLLLRTRDGPVWRVRMSTLGELEGQWALVAGAVHRWLVDHRPHTDEFTLTVDIGDQRGLIIASAVYSDGRSPALPVWM